MDDRVKSYLAEIGRKGGRKSRRKLDPLKAKEMVKVREARRAYRKFHTLCFWSFDPELEVGVADISWVTEGLRKNGNRYAWEAAARLCR